VTTTDLPEEPTRLGRVVIAEDNLLLAEGIPICSVVEPTSRCGGVEDYDSLLSVIAARRPVVVVTDHPDDSTVFGLGNSGRESAA
jgi:hypothetical protein